MTLLLHCSTAYPLVIRPMWLLPINQIVAHPLFLKISQHTTIYWVMWSNWLTMVRSPLISPWFVLVHCIGPMVAFWCWKRNNCWSNLMHGKAWNVPWNLDNSSFLHWNICSPSQAVSPLNPLPFHLILKWFYWPNLKFIMKFWKWNLSLAVSLKSVPTLPIHYNVMTVTNRLICS